MFFLYWILSNQNVLLPLYERPYTVIDRRIRLNHVIILPSDLEHSKVVDRGEYIQFHNFFLDHQMRSVLTEISHICTEFGEELPINLDDFDDESLNVLFDSLVFHTNNRKYFYVQARYYMLNQTYTVQKRLVYKTLKLIKQELSKTIIDSLKAMIQSGINSLKSFFQRHLKEN